MSKGRRHVPAPPAPRPTPAPPVDAFEGKIYRVRKLAVKIGVDIYDDDGRYVETQFTNPPLEISESEFPVGIEKTLMSKTTAMPRGFNGMAKVKAQPKPELSETA